MAYDAHREISEDAIRLRSYLIWQQEGCPCGNELEHWQRAREELEVELCAGPPLRRPTAFVMPRVPISMRPNRIVSDKIGSERRAG
jgi:hypothetical protein